MEYLVGDKIGLIHLISSCFALLFGTMILVSTKGTKRHIKIGYLYLTSMGILILTALMIYRLFGGWGMFHYVTLLSISTIALGMIPIWTKKPTNKWKYLHFSFMYWSVIGLYTALAAEILTRIPKTSFLGMLGVATAGIMLVGVIFFAVNKTKWERIFETKNKERKTNEG